MSDEQPQPNPDETAGNDPDQSPPATAESGAEHDSAPESESANAEAARWRVKLRETETERDGLAAQLEAVRTDQVNAHATAAGITPKALWASGAQLPELLDDNGVVDPDKVAEAVAKARTELGIPTKQPARMGRSGLGPPRAPRDTWRDAFSPRER